MTADSVSAPTAIHATALVVRESGILVRGPSGSGKSGLALCLLELARERRWFAALVGDDRVIVQQRGGRLVARCAANIAGMIERRGQGIVKVQTIAEVVVRLAVDLAPHDAPIERIAAAQGRPTEIAGVVAPRLAFSPAISSIERAYAVLEEIDKRSANPMAVIANFA